MISKRYNKLFNNFEDLKKADAKYQASLNNINQVKKELREIKNIGKLTSKKSNIFFDDMKLNYNQNDIELNHLRDAILTDQIFDNSEVEIVNDKFEDIFNISHSLNTMKNILDKKNVITDILYLELDQSIPSFSKLFKTELNNILNQKKTTKGVNRDLINFKNILDKYTEFDQKTFDEIKNKNGINISTILLNKKYVINILSRKQVDNVEDYIEQIFTEINNFNGSFNDLLNKYKKHINSSAGQINQKIKDILENKTLKNENILEDIEAILNINKIAYEQGQDKKEAEEERLRLEKEAEEERLRQEEEKRLIAQENAKRAAEQKNLEAQERKENLEKLKYFLGIVAIIAVAGLCLWGLWELSVYIWLSYSNIIVNTIGAVLAIISAIVFFGASKVLGVIFFVATAFIYTFLDGLVPETTFKENNKTELVKNIKESSKDTPKINQTNKCPSSGYKNDCKGKVSYSNGTYNGFFKNDKMHGKGTYTWKTGHKLIGTFYNGNPTYGTITFMGKWKGDKYVGNFNNWNRHGQGTYYYKNGNIYSGEWQNGKKHGKGTLTFKSGKVQKGNWKNDKFIETSSKKTFSKKQIKANQTNKCPSSGYKDNCIGIINHNNGRYEGNFKNNKKHGSGSYYFSNGDRFIGDYKNGDVISGSYTYKSGQKFTGKFTKKGSPTSGTERYVGKWKGDKYVGNFNNWKRHGQGTYFYKNGDKHFGEWKKGKRHGIGTYTFKNGKIKKGIWENGKFQYAQGSQNP